MADIGQQALTFGWLIAILGCAVSVAAGLRQRDEWTQVAERSLYVVFGAITISMGALFYALATNDFSLSYVAQHSARAMSLSSRLAALWGGQAGSLLLWGWMIAAYGAAAIFFNRHSNRTLIPWVVVCVLANLIFFLTLCSFVSLPFERLAPLDVRSDGNGLNPLLLHPLMTIHPVVLYAGFTGFIVPYAFAFANLATGELGTQWFQTTRRWTLFAWTCLGGGLILGGRWAYEILGWGGYWGWDPVENAALMPWLAATAYLHSVMIQEKRDMLKTWNLALIGITYLLCVFGTFLTRSGIVQSVHAFTNSGLFTPIFFTFVVVTAVLYFGMLVYRLPQLKDSNQLESMISREAGFLMNNWVFMAILVVVFWGTLLPVVSEALSGNRTTVGPAFFNSLEGWLTLFLLFLTGVGPLIAWRRATVASVRRQFIGPAIFGVVVGAVLTAIFWKSATIWALSCWALSAFVIATITQEYYRAISARMGKRGETAWLAFYTLLSRNQRRYGGYIVHLGIVLMFIAISGAAFNQERLENLKPGESLTIDKFKLRYLTADANLEQDYGGATARVALYRKGEPVATMTPQKRIYWLEQQPSSLPAIYSTWLEDIYLVLNEVEPDGSATFKVHRNPLVNWLWIGAGIAIVGSIFIMWPHPEIVRSGKRT
ncbi:MAG: heme lyase CcmF/NrfE family subunit [Deltaproteobacteria bacterium]|nr:heme lyase CcmF/NrfE family subunit [Deltaproteobacteria bacterium]MBW2723654.1 heme lyase CcmF/NrfE family subunit [Deltaproteobacteria bacterium]